MNAARSSTNLATLLFAGLATVAAGRPVAAQQAGPELKWTPHRASMPVAEPEPREAAPATEFQRPPAAPATVSLPDGVPAAASASRRQAAAAPRRQPIPDTGRPRTPAAAATPSMISQFYDPANPDSVLGFNVMRTPQGPAARPILAAEDRQAPTRSPRGDARLGGGLAPRYAAERTAATGRPDRLAMNVDGIPSVMTRAPQAVADAAPAERADDGGRLPTPAEPTAPATEPEPIGPGLELPDQYGSDAGGEFALPPDETGSADGLLMGEYPTQLHVESFYDDPYACEDEEGLMCSHHGRICAWLRQFGRPYYGWRWYRDFTASAGITSFTNATDLGINGNFGTNEYLNWSMPFWNAFGVGWQIGWRGTQTNFQPATIEVGTASLRKNARDQQFITTGFFTRAFEGRGLQGGCVYDYLHDSWFDNSDVSQLRYELSYVWGYHEFGFWGASNIGDQVGLFGPVTRTNGVASTLDLYTGFYRLQFGDANEWKVWGGGTADGEGIVGTLVRAPMHRSLALEGTFTYVIPGSNQVVNLDGRGGASSFSPSAWNLAVNVVWYPAGRSRRGLASPYRPLFEVADNGSLIRSIQPYLP